MDEEILKTIKKQFLKNKCAYENDGIWTRNNDNNVLYILVF